MLDELIVRVTFYDWDNGSAVSAYVVCLKPCACASFLERELLRALTERVLANTMGKQAPVSVTFFLFNYYYLSKLTLS